MSTETKEFKVASGALVTLKEVNFKEFIDIIPNDKAYHTIEQYNAMISYGNPDGGVGDNKTNTEHDSNYVRSFGLVDELTDIKLIGDLLAGSTFKNFIFEDYNFDRVEAATLDSLENFGNPTHLVKLGDKTFAVLCKDDWKIKRLTETTGTLLGYAPLRNIIFNRYT